LLHGYGEFLNIKQRKFEAAAQQYIQSLPIRHLKQDERLASTLFELGLVLTYAAQAKEAEPYLREYLDLHRRLFPDEQTNRSPPQLWAGEQHVDVARALVHLADDLKAQGKIEQAESSFRQALEVVSNAFADAKSVSTFNATAWILVAAEWPTEWDATLAIAAARKAATATDRKDADILDTLAASFAAAGQFTNAINVEHEAMGLVLEENRKSDFGSRLRLFELHLPVGSHPLLAQRTMVLLAQGKFAEAEPRARACLALREVEIQDAWQTFNARSMLGGSLLGQKHYADAEPLLLSGYEGMKQREGKIPPRGQGAPQGSSSTPRPTLRSHKPPRTGNRMEAQVDRT
jgi:tetratricopeptide (TPR) repeat protein